jgi:hypothetical protein
MPEVSEFTHVGIRKKTQKQIALLAKVFSSPGNKVNIYDLVGQWAEEAWKKAVKKGVVTDAMLDAHWVGEGGKK